MSGARRFESRLSLDASPALPIPWPSGAASAIGSVSLTVADRSSEEVSPLVLIERKRSDDVAGRVADRRQGERGHDDHDRAAEDDPRAPAARGDDVRDARPR